MTRRHFYTTIIAILATIMAKAVPYCDVRKFSINDGLAANTISDLKQGYDNLMWFATWNGLSFYDGYSFHTFRDEPDRTDILSTNRLLYIEPTYNNNIWCITQDRRLYGYDTHVCHFVNVGEFINEKYKIDLRVDHTFPVKNGATWITSVDGKYLLRAGKQIMSPGENLEFFKVADRGLKPGKVWFIRQDPKGREWVLTDQGALIYKSKFSTPIPFKWIRWVGDDVFLATEDGRLALYDSQNRLTMIPMPEGVTRINELKNTGYQLLIATNLGLVTYNPRNFKFEIINVQSPSQPLAEAIYLYTDSYGMVWVFTYGMGVTMVNPRTGGKQWFFADQDNPMDRTRSDQPFITEDEHKTIWVVPNGGTFSYYDQQTGKMVPYLLRSNSSGNYRIPVIAKHTISDQGILWITGRHDLTQVAFKHHPYTINKLVNDEQEVRAIGGAPDGNVWIGYQSGVIQVVNSRRQHIGYISPSGQLTQEEVKFCNNGIYALFFDIKGRAWIGTNGDGIYLKSAEGLQHFTLDPKNPDSLPANNIFDIAADRAGRIWIGTYGGGLALVNDGSTGIQFANRRNGLPWDRQLYNNVRRICCTTTGNILVATTDGIVTFSDGFGNPRQIKTYKSFYTKNDTTTLECSDVNFIMEHGSGKILISELGGTMEQIVSKNLLQDNLKVQYFHQIQTREGIVQSMIEDNQGRIWIVRESSIDCVNLKTGEMQVFGPNDFDFNMSFSEAKPYHDPASNNISVGTPMGMLTFNPATLKKSTYQPKIIFCSVHFSADNTTVPILHKEKLEIPADKRNLTIQFASLDYQRRYQTKYLYRIDGITPPGEWISNGGSNTIGFNHIGHGTYHLKVRATNSHGVWSKHIGELIIDVHPTFWESFWGKFMIFLIICAVGITAFVLYSKRQRQNMTHELSVLKNQFFSDAAHRLRTPLTLIGGPVRTVLENENGLTRQGREMLQMVEKNSKEMLEMLNKVLRYDNSGNFYTNSGIKEEDYDHSEKETVEGQIDDKNVNEYLEEVKKEQQIEEERLTEHGLEKSPTHHEVTLLVVEDNNDLRRYLYNILSESYNVLLAENGKAGLVLARKEIPDFILTDVTMPVMDGLQMVHELKEDSALSNIPILVLSAKASMEDQQKGFALGIDGYLTKPFSAPFLLGRIEAIINQRRRLQADVIRKLKDAGDKDAIAAFRLMPAAPSRPDRVQGQQSAQQKEEQMNMDLEFMSVQVNDKATQRILKYVTDNLGNPDLKIDDIANEAGMSRSVLYNKVKTAVGMTPIDFVRHMRIMKAAEMLRNSNDTLTNIAFNVGFSDPKYFSKVFKKEMGIIPSEYRERTQG